MRTLLIDADLIAYMASAATEFDMGVEVEGHEDEDLFIRVGSLNQALEASIARITRIKNDLRGEVVLCFSGPDNFRKKLYPAYKAQRTAPKPVVFAALKRELSTRYKTFERHGIEADDVMGILATHPTLIKGEKVIVSADKDMRQIPGLLCADGSFIEEVTDSSAVRHFIYQTLVGDTADNYPGCPGIGPKKADAFLDNYPAGSFIWPGIVELFEKAGHDEAFALTQARVARILNSDLYNFATKEPILWSPE